MAALLAAFQQKDKRTSLNLLAVLQAGQAAQKTGLGLLVPGWPEGDPGATPQVPRQSSVMIGSVWVARARPQGHFEDSPFWRPAGHAAQLRLLNDSQRQHQS